MRLVFSGLNMLTSKVETVIWWKRVFGSKSSLFWGIESRSPVWQAEILTTLLSYMLGWLSFPLSFFLVMRHVFSGLYLLTSKVENVTWWGRVFGSNISLCRGIEPRSPMWQTGILTTILTEMLGRLWIPFEFFYSHRPVSFFDFTSLDQKKTPWFDESVCVLLKVLSFGVSNPDL